MLRLLVIEDHALVREGLMLALKALEEDTEVIGAADADEGLALLEQSCDYDAVLLDLMLPGTGGLAALGVIRKRWPILPVAILSALGDADTVSRAMRLGAAGFIPKALSTQSMLAAVKAILNGDIYLPEDLREELAKTVGRRRTVAERYDLTPAQTRVLELLLEGRTNRQISEALGVTEGTVKIHVSAIFKALGVSNRAQAVLLANKVKAKP